MRYVLKGTEPASFSNWKASANDDWSPSYTTLQNPEKEQLHTSLLNEQSGLCCYCGRDIELHNSHIEHFRPQERYPGLALEYRNLHASCLRQTEPGNPLHCGHKKSNWFEEAQHVSPTDVGCEQRFRYLPTGEIQQSSAADVTAAKMIEVLSLDIAYLNNRRRDTLQGFFDNDFIAQCSDADLNTIIEAFRPENRNNQQAFGHVIARYAEQLLIR